MQDRRMSSTSTDLGLIEFDLDFDLIESFFGVSSSFAMQEVLQQVRLIVPQLVYLMKWLKRKRLIQEDTMDLVCIQ